MPFSSVIRRFSRKPNQYRKVPKSPPQPAETVPVNGNCDPEPEPPKPTFLFHTQLAHGSPTLKVGGFSSIRELYEKIAEAFSIPIDEIIFCTLNTHKCDMERLLGGQLGLEDFIFAHVKGAKKLVSLTKTDQSLGLTITDNGTGYVFVKKVIENSVTAACEQIVVGDHIEYINQHSTVGSRHFHVAKLLKEIPEGSTFTLTLIEPKKAFEMISKRNTGSLKSQASINNVGDGKSTLRLRSQGPATLEVLPTEAEDQATHKIDGLLDSFLGIRDLELASTILETGKDATDSDDLVAAIDGQLGDFGFPRKFVLDVWDIILESRSNNTF